MTTPPAWLFDALQPAPAGGTGRTFDWSLAAGERARRGRSFFPAA